jgi:membrane protein YqaA with SNARE-associated domain
MHASRTKLFAFAWGIAEATLFFIIPDVLLSWIALRSRRQALLACLWVAFGALLGGAALWFIGSINPDPVREVFTFLPAITANMISDVHEQLLDIGLVALFLGPLIGTPYKIYAVETASLGYGLGIFLLVSLPARLLRFVIVSFVAGTIARVLQPRLGHRKLQMAHIVFWLLLYATYFSLMPSQG